MRAVSGVAWVAAAFAAALMTASAVSAEAFPGRNVVRIVCPAGPGTPPDVVGRIIANEIAEAEGWRVIVENKPGALQTIAMADVLKQPADGLSVFMMSAGVVSTPALMPDKGLRPDVDFAAVVEIGAAPLLLVVHPSVAAASVRELVALIKAAPDKLTFSSGGFGTPGHLAGELFKVATGAPAVIVPYQQSPQRVADSLAGTTHAAFYNVPAVVDHIATGRLRAIAVTSQARIAALRDVPSIVEQGFPGLLISDWQGFAVKQGSPRDAVDALNAAANRALAKPKIRAELSRLGYEPVGGTSETFGALVSSEVRYWGKVVVESKITTSR